MRGGPEILEINEEKLRAIANALEFRFVRPGTQLETERECKIGLKLGWTTGSCAVEVEYKGPAKPAGGEYIAHYEVQAEEEGGGRRRTPTEIVILEAG